VPEETPQKKGVIFGTKEFPFVCRLSPSLVLQVCTPWQGAMAMFASFPHAPQALTRMVDASQRQQASLALQASSLLSGDSALLMKRHIT